MKKSTPNLIPILCIVIAVITTQCGYNRKSVEKLAASAYADSLKAWVYGWSSSMAGLPDTAITHIDEFVRLSEEKGDYMDLTIALKARYYYYQACSDVPEAYRSSLRRLDVAKLSNDSTQIIDAVYALGRFLFNNGSHYESMDYFLQLADMNLPSNMRGTLFYTMGQVYSVTKTGDDYKELIARYYDLAEAETQKPDFTNTQINAFVLFGRANLLIPYDDADLFEFPVIQPTRVDSLNTAIALLEEAVKIAERPVFMSALALSYSQLGEVRKERIYEQKLLDLVAERPEFIGQANYIRAMSRYHERNFSEAIAYATVNVESLLAINDYANAHTNLKILYYAHKTTGETGKALYFLERMAVVQDSIVTKEKQAQVILNQIKYDARLKDEQIRDINRLNKEITYRYRIFGATGVVFMILSVILFRLYRKKQNAYRELVRKSQEWAQVYIPNDTNGDNNKSETGRQDIQESTSEEADVAVMQEIERLMTEEKIFTDSSLTVDTLARRLGEKSYYVSRIVNRYTKKGFANYVNEYRIKEAIRLITLGADASSMKRVTFDAGFNNRISFYNAFKKITGLSPSDFRKNLQKT